MKQATPRQLDILAFIKDYRKKHGFSPAIREIGQAFGIKSLRGVTVHLEALEAKGLLKLNPGVVRGMVPVQSMEADEVQGPGPCPGFFRIVSGGTPYQTKVYSPEGEDVSSVCLGCSFSVDPEHGVTATLTVLARAEILVPNGHVAIVEQMIRDTVANIGTDKVE